MTTTVSSIEELHSSSVSTSAGPTGTSIDQARVNLFADATDDHQWIHVDPERAAAGPFGGTIAHGYLTLSLIPGILHEVLQVEGITFGVNYGCNKVRFPAPVKVGLEAPAGRRGGVGGEHGQRRGAGRPRHHHRNRGLGQAVVRGPGRLPLLLVTLRFRPVRPVRPTEGRSPGGGRASCRARV